MKILLNGQKFEGILPEKPTLVTALAAVQEQQIADDEVIANILVDGEPLTAERLAEWKGRPVTDFSEAHIEAPKRKHLASKGLRLMAEGLADSKNDLEQLVDRIRQGRSDEAMELLMSYIEIWPTTQQTISSAARLLEFDLDSLEIYEGDESGGSEPARFVKDRFDKLTEQLAQLKAALETGDMVLIGDILDYEFSELTDTWHNMLVQLADRAENQQ